MRPSEHATFEEFHAALEATWRETWARAYALRDECERCATRLSTSSPSPPHSPGPSDAADPLHTTPSNSQGREGGALPGRGRQEQRGEPARQDTRQQGDDVSAASSSRPLRRLLLPTAVLSCHALLREATVRLGRAGRPAGVWREAAGDGGGGTRGAGGGRGGAGEGGACRAGQAYGQRPSATDVQHLERQRCRG